MIWASNYLRKIHSRGRSYISLAVLAFVMLPLFAEAAVKACDYSSCMEACGEDCHEVCTKRITSCGDAKTKAPTSENAVGDNKKPTEPAGKPPATSNEPPSNKPPVANDNARPDTSGEARGSQTRVGEIAGDSARQKGVLREAVRNDIGSMDELAREDSRLALQRANERRRAALEKQAAASERDATQRDVQLSRQAKNAVEAGGVFTRRDALQARDPEVRKKLQRVAFATDVKEELEQEEKKISFDISQLMKLAATAFARGQKMGSVPSEKSSQTPSDNLVAASAGLGRLESAKPESEVGISDAEEAEFLALEAKALESEAAASSDKGKKTKISASALRQAVRAKYSKMLQERKAAEGLAAAQFEGKLTSLSENSGFDGVSEGTQSHRSEGAFDVAASALRESSYSDHVADQTFGPTSQFSMRASETEAEIKNFMEEGSRELASTPSSHFAGILEGDSPSLFERVRSAHKSCLKRRCIRL